MAFGKHSDNVNGPSDGADSGNVDDLDGPFDIDDFEDPSTAEAGRLDLGSVLIPMPEAGQVQVELTEMGVPSAVWVVTPSGRFTVAAYAAPKSAGLWREVAAELADSLRKDVATVNIEDGPWGREVVGIANSEQGQPAGVVRFIGVDGYRWMVRGAAVGSPENAEAIARELRNALSDTVVRRGDTPQPVRNMLPLQLSESLVARLRARAEQMMAEQAQQAGQQPPQPPQVAAPVARRSEQGSAMQQLRTITGG
jgi:hypothetical protein